MEITSQQLLYVSWGKFFFFVSRHAKKKRGHKEAERKVETGFFYSLKSIVQDSSPKRKRFFYYFFTFFDKDKCFRLRLDAVVHLAPGGVEARVGYPRIGGHRHEGKRGKRIHGHTGRGCKLVFFARTGE